ICSSNLADDQPLVVDRSKCRRGAHLDHAVCQKTRRHRAYMPTTSAAPLSSILGSLPEARSHQSRRRLAHGTIKLNKVTLAALPINRATKDGKFQCSISRGVCTHRLKRTT